MASMTDVIFLLLIFFMVTSTFIFPTALEVNLPQSSEQTALKPSKRVYLDSEGRIFVSAAGDREPQEIADLDRLLTFLQLAAENPDEDYIAVYADGALVYTLEGVRCLG